MLQRGLVICGVVCAAHCWAASEYRGRELAIQGMKMVARDGATEAQVTRGWQLVAKGVAVLLSLPGKWQERHETLVGDVSWFLGRCAWASGLEPAYRAHEVTVRRDCWGPCDALLVAVPYDDPRGPTVPGCKMLFAKTDDEIISGAWRENVGRPPGKKATMWRDGRLGAWISGEDVWAVVAGATTGGTSGAWPSAVIVRRHASGWLVVQSLEIHRGCWDSFGLADLNGDGIPEIVGNLSVQLTLGDRSRQASEYVVYKLVGERYSKVWYATIESPAAALARFQWAALLGDELAARAVVVSPRVLQQAKVAGLWRGGFSIAELHDDLSQPYALCGRARGKQYRIHLVELPDGRWRIEDIEGAEAYRQH